MAAATTAATIAATRAVVIATTATTPRTARATATATTTATAALSVHDTRPAGLISTSGLLNAGQSILWLYGFWKDEILTEGMLGTTLV